MLFKEYFGHLHTALLNWPNPASPGAQMAQAASDALTETKDAAIRFTKEHPVYATLIALGILLS